MKKRIVFIAALLCGMCFTTASAQFKIGGKKINVGKVVQAGSDAAKAITLSDADIAAMSKEYMQWMDTHNPLTAADSEYGKRLEKLTGHIKEVDGLKVNFGVYEVVDVNAFACGDGSVRICAGLMDIMTDDEVMAVVGHEIGHVIHTDSKDAMKSAYLRSAVKNAAGAASSTVSKLTDSELGAMAEADVYKRQFVSSRWISSGLGEVNGWCIAINLPSSSLHSNRGKSTTHRHANVFLSRNPN